MKGDEGVAEEHSPGAFRGASSASDLCTMGQSLKVKAKGCSCFYGGVKGRKLKGHIICMPRTKRRKAPRPIEGRRLANRLSACRPVEFCA